MLLILLCSYFAINYNEELVKSVNAVFGIGVLTVNNFKQKNIITPTAFTEEIASTLTNMRAFNYLEKQTIMQSIPETLDYEFGNQDYNDIFNYSIFGKTNKQGGILLVGDSTISWGFSISHFEIFSKMEVHALTFSQNIMDKILLSATENIINCYYNTPPTVMISNSLGSMSKPNRYNRSQDKIMIKISKLKTCKQLYQFISNNKKQQQLLPQKQQKKQKQKQKQKVIQQQIQEILPFYKLMSFETYRKKVTRLTANYRPITHVNLLKIIEPEKFDELNIRSDWSYFRWKPEFKIPFKPNGRYKHKSWDSIQKKENAYFQKYSAEHRDSIQLNISRHQQWAKRNTCFVIPFTREAESTIRKSFLPGESVCWIDFAAIAQVHAKTLDLNMQGNHHFASSSGIIFAAIVGKHISTLQLPTWQ